MEKYFDTWVSMYSWMTTATSVIYSGGQLHTLRRKGKAVIVKTGSPDALQEAQMDGTRSCDNRDAELDFRSFGTTNSVVDIVHQAEISSVDCFDDLSSKLVRQPHKFTRVCNNALTDIDFKPKRNLVPFLGNVENVLYINIYHH